MSTQTVLPKTEIKAQLNLKIEKLRKDITELLDLTKPESPDSAIGRVSRMDAINNRSINEAALRKKRLQLASIEKIIDKIDDPDFGKCKRCKRDIPIGRIMLMPESMVCAQCAW